MSEAKDAVIRGLEQSADNLEAIVGTHDLPGPHDVAGQRRIMNDPNFRAKWRLVQVVQILRRDAQRLRRGDLKQGDWPPFRPEEAQMHREGLAQIRAQVIGDSRDESFRRSIMEAVSPLLEAVQKYAVEDHGEWRFREED